MSLHDRVIYAPVVRADGAVYAADEPIPFEEVPE